MRILYLTVTRQWFSMIVRDEKKEEYRELKDYWTRRFVDIHSGHVKPFDIIRFKNGYSVDAPIVDVEWKGIRIGTGKLEWGCDGSDKYVIKLGKILSIKNFKEYAH